MSTLSVSLQHRFDDFAVDVDFDVPAGVTALYGRSGAGKTSIVNAIAGLLKPEQGRIRLGDRVLLDSESRVFVPAHRRHIGYVFQDARLFPHLSVESNLLYSRRVSRRHPLFDTTVQLLGLEALLTRRPRHLSGGETQRVAIGRALLSEPELLLMDEPLASLDAERKEGILPYLERLRDDTRVPIVYVSHAIAEVARLATSIVILDSGRVSGAGLAEALLSDPDMAPRLGLREAGSLVTARLVAHHEDGLSEIAFEGGRLWIPAIDAQTDSQVRVRIEAQDVLLTREPPTSLSALNILPATVNALRQGSGPGVLVQLQIGQIRLLSRVTRRSAEQLQLRAGTQCFAVINSLAIARDDVGS